MAKPFRRERLQVWDLLNHYLIPGVVIEQAPIKEIVPKLKTLRQNIPGTLMGVFGIDFVGDVVRFVVQLPMTLAAIALGIAVGYGLGPHFPQASWTISGHAISWWPVLAACSIAACLNNIMTVLRESIKTIYFSIFYTAITRPESIQPEMRSDLTRYLRMGNSA